MKRLEGHLYLPHSDYPEALKSELTQATTQFIDVIGDGFFVAGGQIQTAWHQNIWLEPYEVSFSSIKDAAEKLRSLGKLWSPAQHTLFRKAELIQQQLPYLSQKPRTFPFSIPTVPVGSWKLLNETTLWASPRCSSPFPAGAIHFEENKIDPPSSAYLKLWEALTLYGQRPQPGDRCLDAGSCPGGWTWVLAQCGAQVESLDRAPIDERLLSLKNVNFRIGNAFALSPQDFSHLDWFCSDVICAPDKLFQWLLPWIESGKVSHFIITIKMKGEPDWQTMKKFQAVPQSRMIHLFHNKNEVTWML